jgi:hypothetical protein
VNKLARKGNIGRAVTMRTTGIDRARLHIVQRYMQASRGLPGPPSMTEVLQYALFVAFRLVRKRTRGRAVKRRA